MLHSHVKSSPHLYPYNAGSLSYGTSRAKTAGAAVMDALTADKAAVAGNAVHNNSAKVRP